MCFTSISPTCAQGLAITGYESDPRICVNILYDIDRIVAGVLLAVGCISIMRKVPFNTLTGKLLVSAGLISIVATPYIKMWVEIAYEMNR